MRESEKNVRETTLQTLKSDCEGEEVLHVSKYQKLVYHFTKLHIDFLQQDSFLAVDKNRTKFA